MKIERRFYRRARVFVLYFGDNALLELAARPGSPAEILLWVGRFSFRLDAGRKMRQYGGGDVMRRFGASVEVGIIPRDYS